MGIADAEAAGLFHRDRDGCHGADGARILVRLQHLCIIHAIDMVAGQDQNVIRIILVDEIHILIDGVGSSFVPVGAGTSLIRRKNAESAAGAVKIPRFPVADVLVERQGLILCQYAHGINAGVDAVGQGKIDDFVLPSETHGRFCRLPCEFIETTALPAC